jgi:deazaflavin-dependent oxidoreductase (nitroreductase family)
VGVLAIGRVVSPLQRELYRRTGGRFSLTGRAPVLLLTTGRRTAKARTVPLLNIHDGNRLVICNVNPGFERPNPWILNLRAEPHAQIQIGRGTTSVRARPASEHELDRYWPQLTKMWPAYQAFYDKAGERSVFVPRSFPLTFTVTQRVTVDRRILKANRRSSPGRPVGWRLRGRLAKVVSTQHPHHGTAASRRSWRGMRHDRAFRQRNDHRGRG